VPRSQFQIEISRKTLRILLVLCTFAAFLAGFLPDSKAQTPQIRLKKITYLTANLDSSIRAFLRDGFIFDHTEYHPFGPFQVTLPATHQIWLVGSDTTDTTKWQTHALRQFHNHIANAEFEVDSLDVLLRKFDSLQIAHSSVMGGKFSLANLSPLEISFTNANDTTHPQFGNRYSRISWLVLTANDSTEAIMRRVFAALGLRQFHEGCCDYWTLGQVDSRTAIRFELPPGSTWASPPPKPHPEPGWLSIEEGGVVYAY
jgi:hypothetical protein